MDGFNRSLEELLRFADNLKLREKEIEQQHQLELEKQKAEYEIQIQIEKRRAEQLQEINRTLTEQVERAAQTQVELEQKYTVLLTKYNCSVEESKQIKEQHNEKRLRIEELEKIARILTNDKIKLDNEIKQLKTDNQLLQEKSNEIPRASSAPTTQTVPEEFVKLVDKAVTENQELKNVVSERDREIVKLNEQLNQIRREDPELVKQRLLQEINRLKADFRTMFEGQSNFFLQNLDRLKQAQRENIAGFYKH